MMPQSLVLCTYVCDKITSCRPSEGFFSGQLQIFSKVKDFKNPFVKKLEISNKIMQTFLGGCHHLSLVYDTSKLVLCM